jgi:uncharacterized cupin superfamily protein
MSGRFLGNVATVELTAGESVQWKVHEPLRKAYAFGA